MNIAFRLLTAILLFGLLSPPFVQAGGDVGMDPYEIGEKYFARKDYKTALKHYRKALGQNDARAHYRMGLIYEDAGKHRDALRHYRLSLDLDQPDTQRGDTVLRIRTIEERLEAETARSTDLFERGKSLFLKGKYRDAERALLQAVAKDGSKPETHFYLGEVYMKLESYGKAAAEYKKAKASY